MRAFSRSGGAAECGLALRRWLAHPDHVAAPELVTSTQPAPPATTRPAAPATKVAAL